MAHEEMSDVMASNLRPIKNEGPFTFLDAPSPCAIRQLVARNTSHLPSSTAPFPPLA